MIKLYIFIAYTLWYNKDGAGKGRVYAAAPDGPVLGYYEIITKKPIKVYNCAV